MNAPATPPRSSQLDRLFPQGVPGLWCDMLTHVTDQGKIDLPRTLAHARFLAPHVMGVLLNGPINTGEPARPDQTQSLLQTARSLTADGTAFIMLGLRLPLHPEIIPALAGQPYASVGLMAQVAKDQYRDEQQATESLIELLDTGHPVGIVLSDDLLTPATLGELARRYENLLYVDDVAGRMDVINSPALPLGVFRFQGKEANYTGSLGSSGGPYHGLLLASANVFPAMLKEIALAPALGQWDTSRQLSRQLETVMGQVLAITPEHSLAAACRAMDHYMAQGPTADQPPLPRSPTGRTADASYLQAVGRILAQHELLPEQGYLA